MAEALVEEVLGEGLVQAFRGLRRAVGEASEQTVDWLREVAQPPPGVRLTSPDGSTFTGIVLVERSDVVVMLAARHDPGVSGPRTPEAPSSSPSPTHGLTLAERLDPNHPRWDRDINPFHP